MRRWVISRSRHRLRKRERAAGAKMGEGGKAAKASGTKKEDGGRGSPWRGEVGLGARPGTLPPQHLSRKERGRRGLTTGRRGGEKRVGRVRLAIGGRGGGGGGGG